MSSEQAPKFYWMVLIAISGMQPVETRAGASSRHPFSVLRQIRATENEEPPYPSSPPYPSPPYASPSTRPTTRTGLGPSLSQVQRYRRNGYSSCHYQEVRCRWTLLSWQEISQAEYEEARTMNTLTDCFDPPDYKSPDPYR